MSCLPELLMPSKSQPFAPRKVGGPFSLHLRSALFNPGAEQAKTARKPFISNDSKRYPSWMDTEQSFRRSKRSSRSFFHRDREQLASVIEERGHSYSNINNRSHQQTELEVMSNFKAVRKAGLENLQLAQITIEVASVEEQAIKEELASLRQSISKELEDFDSSFREELAQLQGLFRQERRSSIVDNKTRGKQVGYLEEDLSVCQQLAKEVELSFSVVDNQFC